MTDDDPTPQRPDDFLALVKRARRGRVKVYIGSSAGVGKTYRMLEEAHQLMERGVEVVVAFVETHGRPETAALVEGLERIPTRRIRYHDIDIEEMDLDAILARKPAVVLVDELPHTNPPGFRHRWRYQDVEELADAGIHVICAMNVQHLASLGDLVYRATGVRVRETVPDSFLREADQVVNLDISAEDLVERLKAGKIYPQERVAQALASFFRPENLETLRELALREVADALDRRQVSRNDPQGHGKILVSIASRSPNPLRLVERGSRAAGRLNTHWFVVNVKTAEETGHRVDSATERRLHDVFETAQRMGAEVVQLKADDLVEAVLTFARAHGVEHILVGRSLRSRWQEFWREGPVLRLLRSADDIDVTVVPMNPNPAERP